MREMLAPLPDELRAAPDKNGWSARDVVAHLALRQEAAIAGRVRAILAQPGGAIPPVPDDGPGRADWRSRTFEELLRDFASGRAEIVGLLRGVTVEQAALRGSLGGVGELSISEVLHHVAYHDLIHVAQAAQLAYAPLEPLRGAMRRWR